jgi:CheY-like chemotaxis protein
VLLIDDNAVDRTRVQRKLTKAAPDIEVFVCENLDRGLVALRAARAFDCVLVDFNLPDGTGFERIEQARELQEPPPILRMTGQCRDRGVEALRAGAEDYLIKGDLDAYGLLRAVNHAIERHRIRLELVRQEA